MTDDLPQVVRDVRTCALGDSFVAGVGDPEHRGWVGRVVTGTLYNLGVRRETSGDVLARWAGECAPRLPSGVDGRVLVSFGVNDTTAEGDGVRVDPEASAANLAVLLGAVGHPVLVVGPPPVADPVQNRRITVLSRRFGDVCMDAGVPFVPVADALLADEVWTAEVAAGDGAHPGTAGYVRLADLVRPTWESWICS